MKYPFKSHAKSLRQLCEYCPIGAFLLHSKRICQKETNSDFFCDKNLCPTCNKKRMQFLGTPMILYTHVAY